MKAKLGILLLSLTLGFSAYKNWKQFEEKKDLESQIEKSEKVQNKQSVIITRYIAPDKTQHAVYTETYAKTDNEKYIATLGYIDSLKKALNISVAKIGEVTRVKAMVQDKVKTTVTDSNGVFKTYAYKNKWLDAKLTTKDSMLAYSYNVELVDTKYYKGNWFTGRTYYRDVSLADPNGYITGVQRFTLPPDRTKRLGLGVQFGYSYNVATRNIEPSIGLGLSYNFIRF